MAYKQKIKNFQEAIAIIGWMHINFSGTPDRVLPGSDREWRTFDKALAEGTPTGQRGGLFLSELRHTYLVNSIPNLVDLPPIPENALLVRIEEVQRGPTAFQIRLAYRIILGE